ncbi:hypothetical protein CPB85DRAFT_262913 [Mucidula mucida]|nr:hypothetical protein CPB85DRAFT_262913 [Mucidula mucida]
MSLAFLATAFKPPSNVQKHALVAQVCALPGNEHFTFHQITSWFKLNDSRPRQRGPRPSELTQMLKFFLDTISHKSQRITLLAQVRALPGKENYTRKKLSVWFATHRRSTGVSSRQRGRPRIQRGLTDQGEVDLVVFIRETPNPSDDLLAVWARALGCDVAEIKVCIERKRAERMLTPEAEDDEYSDCEDEEDEEVAEIQQQAPPLSVSLRLVHLGAECGLPPRVN